MNTIFLLSIAGKARGAWTEFHFKGFYKGSKISKIWIKGNNFEEDKEYLLQIELLKIQNEIIYAICRKKKLIFSH